MWNLHISSSQGEAAPFGKPPWAPGTNCLRKQWPSQTLPPCPSNERCCFVLFLCLFFFLNIWQHVDLKQQKQSPAKTKHYTLPHSPLRRGWEGEWTTRGRCWSFNALQEGTWMLQWHIAPWGTEQDNFYAPLLSSLRNSPSAGGSSKPKKMTRSKCLPQEPALVFPQCLHDPMLPGM